VLKLIVISFLYIKLILRTTKSTIKETLLSLINSSKMLIICNNTYFTDSFALCLKIKGNANLNGLNNYPLDLYTPLNPYI